MEGFREIPIKDCRINPFDRIGNQWMLIAAEKGGRTNAMTAAWGGLGHMWRRHAAFMVIRPQRFTKEFVDAAPVFSLNFFAPDRRKTLDYFGSVSGRDEDKIAKSGLRVETSDGAPYFAEAELVFICRKLYAQPFKGEFFIDPEPDRECYPEKDYHTLYVGEVVRVLGRGDS
ncbi:MAG: flavin reductase [Planctomycetota bacterium]|jgi:flavin reductase (DIM6/NTAB) family NADH-FMN oxidoreductase RutF|nr:flavin reductase [Planctomycetota bacterium]